jgi:hypothetical protein
MTRSNSNKKKYNKRYNKKRKTIKTGKKTQRGGTIPSIRELIFSDKLYTVLVDFDGLKLECQLGANMLSVGNILSNCIYLNYFDNNSCVLESFFYNTGKLTCVGEKKTIDNSTFRSRLTSEGINPSEYQKQLNTKLLEFIDILNMNMGILYCTLTDASKLSDIPICGDLSLFILKRFERGYGFYNEFGYCYIPSRIFRNGKGFSKDANILQTIFATESYSSDILRQLNEISNKSIKDAIEYMNTYEYIDSRLANANIEQDSTKKENLKNYLKTFLQKINDDLNTNLTLNYILKLYIDHGKITIRQLIKDMMEFCKSPENAKPNNFLKSLPNSSKFTELFGSDPNYSKVIAKLSQLPQESKESGFNEYQNDRIKNFITKIEDILKKIFTVIAVEKYEHIKIYNEADKTTSTLVDKDNDASRRFEMRPMKNHTLEVKETEDKEKFTLTITTTPIPS